MNPQVRTLVELLPSQRGQVKIDGKIPDSVAEQVNQGMALLAAVTHPALLPKVQVFEQKQGEYPKWVNHWVYILPQSSAGTVAHELAHEIESTHPEVLQACKDFLEYRAGGEPLVPYSKITGKSKHDGIMIYEDEWKQRGGDPYTGRKYGPDDPDITEILSTGVKRLVQDPLRFAQSDREFFVFVVKNAASVVIILIRISIYGSDYPIF